MKNLKIVILKCPYINWKSSATQECFAKVVDLKLKSYCEKHHLGVMPVDTTDFICDHILVCEEEGDSLTPILGVKSLDYSRCDIFHVDFTISAFLKNGGHAEHLTALNEILDQCRQKDEKIAYYSSWAMLPEVTRNRPLATSLKNIFTGLTVLHHTHEGIAQLLGLGVPKYRTDQFFKTWGFDQVAREGQVLDNIPFFILGDIDGVFIHLKQYSEFALDCADNTMDMWKNRLVIGDSPRKEKSESSQLGDLRN